MNDTDYKWLMCGDYALRGGDFDDTSDSPAAYEVQETISRCRLSKRELYHDSDEIAGNLETWLGQEATEETARKMRDRLTHALTYYRYLAPNSSLNIKTLLLSNNEIGVYLKVHNSAYRETYINVYLDFEAGTASMLVEEATDVHHPQ